ncbi:hypothetical protein G2W53_012668 [Senna tora]|uniref:Uncharacterized protein n=1 Tax=Senna tora TaxID=362788 RepID=A0A834U1L7_9FABA|nr:hypothetical protein G2W53_012668 [Senna tora]
MAPTLTLSGLPPYLSPQNLNPCPHERAVAVLLIEEPIVHVPRDLNGNPIHFHSLIPSEFPLQSLNLQYPFAIHTETEPRVVPLTATTIDLNLSHSTSEFGSGGVHLVGDDMFPLENEKLGGVGLPCFGSGVGFLGGIADQEDHLLVEDEGDVEGGEGFRARAEFGLGNVPEDVGVGGDLLGAVLFPEEEGLDVEVERGRGGIGGVEVEMEGATQNGARPCEGNEG